MWKESEKEKTLHTRNRMKKIEKDKNSPGQGDYLDLKALKDAVLCTRTFKFKTDTRTSFTDKYAT